MPSELVCKLCGAPAEFRPDENVYRHKGHPWDSKHFAQTFCDRYGYPIPVSEGASDAK